jgi:hypothetical protein
MISVGQSGFERGMYDLRKKYDPYNFQRAFHSSPAPYGFLGGAAGPGKTLAMIMEQFQSCNEFDHSDGPSVHTLLLRRTNPKLEATVITRFRETIDPSLYRQFNLTKSEVTWLNGATTLFGSMQYDHNAWDYQGQWLQIGYDEACEFTFNQWMATSAWNRCPVSPYARKYGAGNPIGIGALWVEDLFVKHVVCNGMDDEQKRFYDPKDYGYFPATYLDNPVYANDPNFLKNLMAYPVAIREALMYGKWGVAGGYFRGIWDEAVHVFGEGEVDFEPWWKRWISGNWGYEHPAAFYKHCMDDHGVLYTYDEMVVQHQSPERLAESVCNWAVDDDGSMPKFVNFAFSFDAQRSMATSTMGSEPNSIAQRMTPILRKAGIPEPFPSTRDKLGRDSLMRERMEKRIRVGEDGEGHFVEVPNWRISRRCKELIRVIPVAKADDADPEKIEAVNDGSDSPLQGAGYGLYSIWGRPARLPMSVRRERVAEKFVEDGVIVKPTELAMAMRVFESKERQKTKRRTRWSAR